MVPAESLSTGGVSAASGYSVQQIRDLEARGVIPPARRAANGYREFSGAHLRALRAYRNLAAALDPVRARRVLRELRGLPPDHAAALVNSLHTELARQRDDALAAQRAVRLVRAEAAGDAAPAGEDAMTITQLAAALDVRTSTLRFWEKAGLLTPERVTSGTVAARRYPVPAVREARIVAALRAAGYRVPDVRTALQAIRTVRELDEPDRALRGRVETIAERTLALLRAGTDLAEMIAQR